MFTSSLGTVRPQPFEQDTGFLGLKSHSLRWPDIRSSLITAVHPKTSFSHLKEGVGRTEYGPCTQRVPTDPKQHRVLQESNPECISSFSPHFESGEHVPEDPGHGLEGLAVGDGQPVDGARRLPGDPLADAGEAEGVLAVGGLQRRRVGKRGNTGICLYTLHSVAKFLSLWEGGGEICVIFGSNVNRCPAEEGGTFTTFI